MIEDAIAATAPAIVYTHTLCDLHQDHRNVHRASMVAARNVPSVYCLREPLGHREIRTGPLRVD